MNIKSSYLIIITHDSSTNWVYVPWSNDTLNPTCTEPNTIPWNWLSWKGRLSPRWAMCDWSVRFVYPFKLSPKSCVGFGYQFISPLKWYFIERVSKWWNWSFWRNLPLIKWIDLIKLGSNSLQSKWVQFRFFFSCHIFDFWGFRIRRISFLWNIFVIFNFLKILL